MRNINFVVPTFRDSFYLSAVYYAKWLDHTRFRIAISTNPKPFWLNIRLNDMWNEFRRPVKADIYMLDTPQYYNDIYRRVPLQRLKPRYIFVASTWNQEMAEQYFENVAVIPRLPHPLYLVNDALPYSGKEYDLAFVSGTHPRKAFKEFIQVCEELRLKCWYTGSYSRYDLYTLIGMLKKTKFIWWLSKSEGFGLGLIEAQALGVPALCLYAHTSKDYCFTCYEKPELWVEPREEKVVELPFGRHKLWLFDIEEAKKIVKEALSMDEEEYTRLSNTVKAKTRRFVTKWAKYINELLYTI